MSICLSVRLAASRTVQKVMGELFRVIWGLDPIGQVKELTKNFGGCSGHILDILPFLRRFSPYEIKFGRVQFCDGKSP